MLFRERPTEIGYCYVVEDVFGEIELRSPEPLNAENLDALVMYVMKTGHAAGTLNEVITFSFKKADLWMPEEEKVIH